MWINKQKSDANTLVFPETHEDVLLKNAILAWAEKNPRAQIAVWYDSEFVTPQQITNTEDAIGDWNQQLARDEKYKIKLENARNLPRVEKNSMVFSPLTPTYFRADLFRIMATVNVLEKCAV